MILDPGLLADLVLMTHVVFVLFVVAGLALVLAGGACGWRWARNPWFRSLHAAAIGFVAAEAWLGAACPLTTLEMSLRHSAAQAAYGGDFVAHWLHAILFYEVPPWVFVAAYTAFAAAVATSWIVVRPRGFGSVAAGDFR